ncbi:succinate dehydrogenase subunit 7B, mitochondrial [Magnolia sinica]|uniref:succinate dehydrogenase subunit 7B, mitochondrial n=1 Tax=Magnolia sinica TaxID=86752 RepID=UPI0026592CBD|nr:succinate dehydrogenase subunit 7B, mitochondrial [Magnolia sinica]
MAFLLSKASPFSRFQIHSQPNKIEDPFLLSRRRFHLELGAREKALLEEDPALKKFKSYKKSVWRLKRVGDVLTIIVVAGCCYEIYVKTVMKKAAVEEAKAKNSGA